VTRKLKRIKINEAVATKSKLDLTQKKPSAPRHPKRVFKSSSTLAIASNSVSDDQALLLNNQVPVVIMKGKNKNNKNKNSLLIMSDTESHEKMCKARVFIKKLFTYKGDQYNKNDKYVDIKEYDANRLSSICLDVWRTIIKTQYYQKTKNVYHFIPHCYVVLYNSKWGTYINGEAVIQQDDFVAQHLIESKDLSKIDKQVSKLYTRTSAQLNEMMREHFELINDKID